MGAHNNPSSRLKSQPHGDLNSPESATLYAATLTVRNAAIYSGLSTDRVRDLVNSRQWATLDRGANGRGHIHILRASIDAWIAANTVGAVSPDTLQAPRRRSPLDADRDLTFPGQPLFS